MSAPKTFQLYKGDDSTSFIVARLPEKVTIGDLKASCEMKRIAPSDEFRIAMIANKSKYIVGTQDYVSASGDPGSEEFKKSGSYCHFIIENMGNNNGRIFPVSKFMTFMQTIDPSKVVGEKTEEEISKSRAEAAEKRKKDNAKRLDRMAKRVKELSKEQSEESVARLRQTKKRLEDEDEGVDAFAEDVLEEGQRLKQKQQSRRLNEARFKDDALDEDDVENSISVGKFRKRVNGWDHEDGLASDDEEDIRMNSDEEKAETLAQKAREDERRRDSDAEAVSSSSEDEDDPLAEHGKYLLKLMEEQQKKNIDDDLEDITSEEEMSENEGDDEDAKDEEGDEEKESGQAAAQSEQTVEPAKPLNAFERATKIAEGLLPSSSTLQDQVKRGMIDVLKANGGRMDSKLFSTELKKRLNFSESDFVSKVKPIFITVFKIVAEVGEDKSIVKIQSQYY